MLLEEQKLPGAVLRAIQKGEVEVLGWFTYPHPIAVVALDVGQKPSYLHLSEARRGEIEVAWRDFCPPWRFWLGPTPKDAGRWGGYDHMLEKQPTAFMLQGDNPTLYHDYRTQDQAQRHQQ